MSYRGNLGLKAVKLWNPTRKQKLEQIELAIRDRIKGQIREAEQHVIGLRNELRQSKMIAINILNQQEPEAEPTVTLDKDNVTCQDTQSQEEKLQLQT